MTNVAPFYRLIPFGLLAVLIIAAACDPQPENTPPPVASATPTPPTTAIPVGGSESPATPLPVTTPTVRLTPIHDGQTLTFRYLPEPYPLDVYSLAQQFLPDADLSPLNMPHDEVGDARTFFVYNIQDSSRVELDARLCVSTENLDFYLDENLGLTCAAFRDDVTRRIEEVVRPTVIANFAGDPTAAEGLGSPSCTPIFLASAAISMPQISTRRNSIPMRAGAIRSTSTRPVTGLGNPRDAAYASLVAHELQHAIHELFDPDESTWINEGLSVLAEEIATTYSRVDFFVSGCPPTQINAWPSTPGAAACNYAGAGLFMRYLRDNYPGPDGTLRMLVAESADGLRGIESYLSEIGADVDVLELMADWGVSNYLDGREIRGNPDVRPSPIVKLDQNDRLLKFFTQFAAQYLSLPIQPGTYTIDFQGDTTTPLFPRLDETLGSFWHAGSEDSATYSLTREFDLRDATPNDDATLTLLLRYDTEENWDYLYATVSTDDGQTWQVLRSPSMQETSDVAFGSVMFDAGFTGISGSRTQPQWILEELDLSGFVGEQILFRLLYLTDQSISLDGVSLAGAWLPAANYGWAAINHPVPIPLANATANEQPDGGWTPDGFFFSNNLVQQDYAVRLMTVSANGDAAIIPMHIDSNGHGTLAFDNPDGNIDRAAVMVMPLAPQTRQPADASLTIRPADET